jgi:hypothetical protein
VDRGKILRTRNQRQTESMRWDMLLNGTVTINYPPQAAGSPLVIDYGFLAGHKPTATTLWSDTTNSNPVTDIQAWSEKLADDSGFYGRHIHMNSKTYNYLIQNAKIQAAINIYNPSANTIYRPRRGEILDLFTTFAIGMDIHIYDNGYRAVGQTGIGRPSLTKYLPDGYVLMTTDYSIDGHNIADMLNGEVTVSTGYNTTDVRIGEQAEVMLDHMSKTHFLRYASARIPRLLIPEAVLAAKVT